MKVLRVRPKHYPEVIDIDGSLESLQKEVEGPIQAVYPWDDEVALICNEEGKLHGGCNEQVQRYFSGDHRADAVSGVCTVQSGAERLRASDDPAGQRADGAVPDQRYHGHRGTGELVEEQLVYERSH